MAEDFTVTWGATRHESMPLREGGFQRSTVYTFWIGKHGPFVERIDRESDDGSEIRARVERLRTQLRTLPT